MLTELSPRQLRETAIGAAWMAAAHLHDAAQFHPGVGAKMLQAFSLILAEFEEPP